MNLMLEIKILISHARLLAVFSANSSQESNDYEANFGNLMFSFQSIPFIKKRMYFHWFTLYRKGMGAFIHTITVNHKL